MYWRGATYLCSLHGTWQSPPWPCWPSKKSCGRRATDCVAGMQLQRFGVLSLGPQSAHSRAATACVLSGTGFSSAPPLTQRGRTADNAFVQPCVVVTALGGAHKPSTHTQPCAAQVVAQVCEVCKPAMSGCLLESWMGVACQNPSTRGMVWQCFDYTAGLRGVAWHLEAGLYPCACTDAAVLGPLTGMAPRRS